MCVNLTVKTNAKRKKKKQEIQHLKIDFVMPKKYLLASILTAQYKIQFYSWRTMNWTKFHGKFVLL